MSKVQTDSYKMNESKVETIDEEGELIRIDLILEKNDPVIFNGEITGKVTDTFGFPIVGAKVTLKYNSDKTIFKEVYSDSNHTYLLENVPINTEFELSASHPIYIPKTLENPIIVEPFETVNKDIKLISILGIIFGVLLDIYRKPVIIGTLLLYLNPPPPASPILIGTTAPEKDGKFTFPEVPFGKYELVAQTGLYKDVSTTFDYINPNTPLDIELEFEEEKPARIIGRITDTKSSPIFGAIVTLKTFPEFLPVNKVFSDAFGNYALENVVPSKSFVVSAIAMYYTESTSPAITPAPASTVTQNLSLNDLLGSIIGKLLGTDSKPVSGNVSLYTVSSSSVKLQSTTANLNGDFSFTGIPRGNYAIVATNIKYKEVSNSYSYNDSNFPLSVTLKFLEENTSNIIGKITNSKGSAIQGALVTLKSHPDLLDLDAVFTDALGNYSLEDVTGGKSYVVSSIADQYKESTSPIIALDYGTTFTQNLSLNDLLGSIIGKLLDTDSKPISGDVSLYTVSSSSVKLQSTTANSNGDFTFNGIPRGEYAIVATNIKYKEVSNSYSYTDANFPLNVTLKFLEKNTSDIVGKITDSKGSAIQGAIVTLKSSPDFLVLEKVFSDSSGNYSIKDVIGDKSYVVSAIADQYTESTSNVITLESGITFTQNLSLKDLLGSIVGKLLGTDSKPVSGDVSLYTVSSNSIKLQSTTANSNGDFTFNDIPRGDYAIVATNIKYKEVSNSYSYDDANFPLSVTLKFLEENTSNIIGKITNSKGSAIQGALVTLKSHPDFIDLDAVFTDALGNYSLEDVTGGKSYIISATADQYKDSTSPIITLDYGTTFTQNLSLDDLLGSITGTLLDVNSNPIIADLSLYDNITSSSIDIIPLASEPIQTTTSDSSGKFTFNNIPIGSYKIIATSPYYKDISHSFNYDNANEALNISLKFSQSIFIDIKGTVKNIKNQLIENATITIKSHPDLIEITKVSTDSSGNYIIKGANSSESFIIHAIKDFYDEKKSNVISGVNGNVLIQDFILTAPSGTVGGRILDNVTSKPVKDVWIRLYLIQPNNFANQVDDTYTDDLGNYKFSNVNTTTEGYKYNIFTFLAGYNNSTENYFTYNENSVPFIINDIIINRQLKGLQFYIKDNLNNIVKTATVIIKRHPSMEVVGEAIYEDLVGNYGIGDLTHGDYIAIITGQGYSDYNSDVITLSFTDTSKYFNIILTAIGTIIEGKVINNFDENVDNADVYLYYHSNSTIVQKITTDKYFATYKFDPVEANDYFLGAILRDGYKDTYTGKITVNTGDAPKYYTLKLIGAGSISASVSNVVGAIANATVYLYYALNSKLIGTRTTNSSGDCYFGDLPPNDYFIKATAWNHADEYSSVFSINGNNVGRVLTLGITVILNAPNINSVTISTPYTYNYIYSNATWGERYSGARLNFENKFVDYLGGFLGGHVFVNITVPISSSYEVKVRYLAGDRDRLLKVRVVEGSVYPGTSNTKAVLSKTNGWNVSDAKVGSAGRIYLKEGSNRVVFFNDEISYAPAISDLYFSYAPDAIVASVPSGRLFNGAFNRWIEYWGRSVKFTLGIGTGKDGYVLLDYNFPTGGRYDFNFYYLSPNSSRLLSVLLSGKQYNFTFPQTPGSWLTDARNHTITLYSAPGNQTIKFFSSILHPTPDLAYAHVSFVPYSKTVYSHEFALTGSAYINSGFIKGITSNSGSLKFNVSVDAPGYYDVTIRYLDSRPGLSFKININGSHAGTFDVPPASYVRDFTVKLNFNNWTNSVEIYR